MKKQITRAEARRRYAHIYKTSAGYLDFAGYGESHATAYNTGVYGWNWDLIPISGNVALCAGYRADVGTELPKDIDARIRRASAAWHAALNDIRTPNRDKTMAQAVRRARRALADLVRRARRAEEGEVGK